MTENRYNRWQGFAIAQFSVAIALISGLSVASLGAGFSLLQNKEFLPIGVFKNLFEYSFVALLFAVLFSCSSVITRLLDFRLTARKVRKEQNPNYNRPLKIFRLDSEAYGQVTWWFFGISCLMFFIGVVLLFVSVAKTYSDRF